MTRIDFYTHVRDKWQVAVQLVGKAWEKKQTVWIRVENEPMANHLDTLLWTHPPGGFVPHCRADHELAGETPVLIDAWNREPVSHQLLINLCPDLPEYFSRFERLIEIVGLEDEDRQKARDRFVYYRDRGFDLHSHNLSQLRS